MDINQIKQVFCAGILIYCTYKEIQAPNITEAFMMTCAALLGLDSITSIWKKE